MSRRRSAGVAENSPACLLLLRRILRLLRHKTEFAASALPEAPSCDS
jgi:hypothetical protein